MITWDDIINAADSVSINVPTNVMSAMSTNVTSTVSTTFYKKKIRSKINCYNLHTALLVVTSLVIIAIICYHYAKHINTKMY